MIRWSFEQDKCIKSKLETLYRSKAALVGQKLHDKDLQSSRNRTRKVPEEQKLYKRSAGTAPGFTKSINTQFDREPPPGS